MKQRKGERREKERKKKHVLSLYCCIRMFLFFILVANVGVKYGTTGVGI
jgi:hypothetical protein